MKIAINKIHFPVTTLGYGQRLGIWMQGCSIRCAGCISKDTWDREEQHDVTLDHLLESCASWLDQADGVTISGGEPFDQPLALAALVAALRASKCGDVLVYTGYSRQCIEQRHPDILPSLDVLISEPYCGDADDSLILRGSDNQHVALLTSLARQRYPADVDLLNWPRERRLDVMMTDSELWLAGIPRKGEIARLKLNLKARGYDCRASDQPRIRA